MDPEYPIRKLIEMQDDITECCKLLLNRFNSPLTDNELDHIHHTLGVAGGRIRHLELATKDAPKPNTTD